MIRNMKLQTMINELLALGESQSSLAAAMEAEIYAPTQSTISKIISKDRDPSYNTGKVIELYYKANIARLRRKNR